MNSDNYKAEREKRGTQTSVAALLGVNRVTVAKREAGMQPITREAWLALLALPKNKARALRQNVKLCGGSGQ
jgi:hypothetical protein